MHSTERNGYDFFYNGDYSGSIKVINENGDEFKKSFQELAVTALYDRLDLPFTQAARGFVAEAAVNEGISRLEQMGTDEILANPWLKSLLDDMTTN
jgi:hypothetical protein